MDFKEKYVMDLVGEKLVEIKAGQSILDASLSAGIPHFHACGGNAKCSTCWVLIVEGETNLTSPLPKEMFLKNQMHFPPNVRLACQTQITGEGVRLSRIIQDETDIGLYVGSAAGDSTQQLGEEKEMGLLFLDIRNFTNIVETLPAFDVIHIIRKLFSSFQSSVERNGGRIVETTGDGIYAVFGYTTNRKQGAIDAVHSATALLQDLEILNKSYFIPYFQERIQIGIGVHVGRVISGSVRVGKEDRSVVMGFPVNVTSRLQNSTKQLNNNFVISGDVYDLLSSPPLVPSQALSVKGVSTPLVVYLMGQSYGQAKYN